MANKVKYGLSNVHYAKFLGFNETTGVPEWSTPVALPGAVNLTSEAEANESAFYADNKKYYVTFSKNGYTGELELALIPESFEKDILGRTEEGNLIVESPEDKYASFALGYQIDGDETNTLFWDLHCDVSAPSTEASTTEDSTEPKTEKMSITSTSIKVNGHERARVKTKANATAAFKATFFDSVVYKDTTGNTESAAKVKPAK